MKNLITSCFFVLSVLSGFSQNPDFSKIKFWTGNGQKVAMLVIDFNDGSANESYAWGYRFDGNTVSAENMLMDIVANDTNLSIVFNGGFLSNINYINHSGIGGSPYYWSTFTMINNLWNSNMGYSEILSDSMIFGNSYTDFDQSYNPITMPETPIPAPKPFILQTQNIINWTGNGSKKAYLVVDFNDSTTPQCYAWGYKFDSDTITAEQMINDIALTDNHFSVNIGSGFLNDINYFNHSGIGGNPYYWASFTLNSFIWEANFGISEILQNNTIFGLSYTDWDNEFNPIFEPENATPASLHTEISEVIINDILIYPNPANNFISFKTKMNYSKISIVDLSGNEIFECLNNFSQKNQIDVSMLSKGAYLLKVEMNNLVKTQLFIKK